MTPRINPVEARLVVEYNELDRKFKALQAFLEDEETAVAIAGGKQVELMKRQYKAMEDYLLTLIERIELFRTEHRR